MSEKTGIGWCDSTGNPWIGCTKVSPGCKNCYAAELDANKFSRTMGGGTKEKPISHWGKGAPRVRTKGFWKDAVRWNAEAGRYHYSPVRPEREFSAFGWRPHKPRIFPSLCDWLDDEVPIEWLADFLKLIHDTPNLDWLLLTKRPENWESRIEAAHSLHVDLGSGVSPWIRLWLKHQAPSNVWLGVSVENQAMADLRIPQLLQIPAKVRFLSVEPLLSAVDLNRIRIDNEVCAECKEPVTNSCLSQTSHCGCCVEGDECIIFGPIDWVIVGLESGEGRRDGGVEALVDVANQCVAAEVPCFVKQDCALKPGQRGRIPDEIWKLIQFPC